MEGHVPNGIAGLIPVGTVLDVVPLHLGGVAVSLDGVGVASVVGAILKCPGTETGR